MAVFPFASLLLQPGGGASSCHFGWNTKLCSRKLKPGNLKSSLGPVNRGRVVEANVATSRCARDISFRGYDGRMTSQLRRSSLIARACQFSRSAILRASAPPSKEEVAMVVNRFVTSFGKFD